MKRFFVFLTVFALLALMVSSAAASAWPAATGGVNLHLNPTKWMPQIILKPKPNPATFNHIIQEPLTYPVAAPSSVIIKPPTIPAVEVVQNAPIYPDSASDDTPETSAAGGKATPILF